MLRRDDGTDVTSDLYVRLVYLEEVTGESCDGDLVPGQEL